MITDKLKNGSSTLSFSLYKNNPFINEIEEEFYVETFENRYVIKSTTDQQTVKRYMCVLDLESLESKLWIDGFSNVEATADATVRLAIAGTGWSVESRNLTTKKRTLRLDSTNAYEIITKALTKWDIEVHFNAKDKVITLSDNIGEDKGVYFTDELNLSTINIEGDSTDFATRLYVRGKDGLTFADINSGKDYIENFTYSDKVVSKLWVDERYEHKESMLEDARIKLEGMCKPVKSYELEIVDLASLSQEYDFLAYGIGDTVTLLSASNKIRESHRIIEMTRYPLEPERNKAVLSNGRLTFEELQQKNEEMADTVDGWANEDGTLNGSKVDGILTEQITDFEAKVAQITDLTVVNAKIDNLEANKASIGQLSAVVADIGELRANTATIDQLKATNAQIENLKAENVTISGNLQASNAQIGLLESSVATIEKLYATKADIDELRVIDANIQNAMITKADIHDLNAAVADIGILNADLATIKHLVGGNLSSENIQAGGISSDKLTIANGFIKDAMIDSLNANKIATGQINTAHVQVASASGNLVINDNTIQIRDANRVRVQIGKDASNDYSMSVWDSSGKLMFDARGLKADAIKDSIIRDDMVAPGANIDGSKLNISSVVSSINNSSSTLKASKVEFDGIAQTLEVAFNALQVEVDDVNSKTESNTTAINVAQGKINTLIQDTTITKNGQTIKLKDEYSRLEQTVNGLSSTVGAQQTIIDANTGKITATNSELTSLKQNVNGLSMSVSTAQTTLQNHTTQLNNKADLSVVNQKIDNIQVGGRNLLVNSNKTVGESATREFIQFADLAPIIDEYGLIEYTISFDIKSKDITNTNRIQVYLQNGSDTKYSFSKEIAVSTKFERKSITVIPTLNDATVKNAMLAFFGTYSTGNIPVVKNVKVEKGNKNSDYTQAPEDVQSSIDTKSNITDVYNKTEVYTKAQTDSQIKVAKDSITQSVSSTYETKSNVTTQINGVKNTISSLQTRVNTAEQKITDSAIVSTVTSSTTYKNNLNGKVDTNKIISTINQTAEAVKINASKIDLSGYVTISNLSGNGTTTINGANIKTGVIKSTDSSFWIDLNNGRMAIYDSNKLLAITHKMKDNKSGKYGLGFQANRDSFIALSIADNDDNTVYKPYIALAAKELGDYKAGINLLTTVNVNQNSLQNPQILFNGFKRNSGDYATLYSTNQDSNNSKLILELGNDYKSMFEIWHKFYNKDSADLVASFRGAGGSESNVSNVTGIKFFQNLGMQGKNIWGIGTARADLIETQTASVEEIDVQQLSLTKIARFNIDADVKYRIPASMQESIEHFGHAELSDNYCRVNLPLGFNHRGYIITISPLSSGEYEIIKHDEYFEIKGNIKSFDYIIKGFI